VLTAVARYAPLERMSPLRFSYSEPPPPPQQSLPAQQPLPARPPVSPALSSPLLLRVLALIRVLSSQFGTGS
jgi:hypothetical protein